ncbi:M14 family metallopeptidase [Atopobium fossor]|uniref:M14 family metallopeptidase n=1 Tax=Atopobium fossor TaxID=39487 RepID=UPI0004241824|nr:M14 family metallopeptidase [Atopobium fossor]
MASQQNRKKAVIAALVLSLGLGTVAAPPLANFVNQRALLATVAQAETVGKFERTDAKAVAGQKVGISMTEERSYKATVPTKAASVEELQQQIDAGKVTWTLSRDKGIMDPEIYPKQYMGGKLDEWKTVAVKVSGSPKIPSQPMFSDITMRAEDVDGTPSIVLTFNNKLLFGLDGIDVRARATVRSAMYDYTGTFKLACSIDGTEAYSTDVDVRPYDEYRTQEEIYQELPELVAQANANGMYAEIREIGKTVQGRPIQAVFVAKSKADLDNYQALKQRMESEPAKVQEEVRSGSLKYKVPVVYSNVHADEIVAVDAIMEFMRDLSTGKPLEYKTVTGLTEAGKQELATEMTADKKVWSDLIKDQVTGIGYLRGDGGGGSVAAADLTEDQLDLYYNRETRTFDPSKLLDDMFFILIPSENADAREVNVRTNANAFDLNRDNTYQTQPETQAMSGFITEWDPLSLHELHGYYEQYQVEPCSPTHDPNNEYDLFIDTALAQGEAFMGASISNNETINSVQMPMRDYLKIQDDGSKYWAEPFDDMSTSYTPQYAMMHGTNAYTVEAPSANVDALYALEYGFIGNADFIAANKDRMFINQLERFRRGIENIDADTIRPYYVNQNDVAGAEADIFRPQNNENHNFFPEYYVIPMDAQNQQDRAAASKTVALLLHNGVKINQLNKDVTVGDKTYAAGTVIVDMHQAKRNMANCVLYPNLVISDWAQYTLYSEPVTNFADFRGFDMDTIRKVGVFAADAMDQITEAPKTATVYEGQGCISIVKNNGLDAINAVNALLKDGKSVGLITEGEHAGSYVVAASDLNTVQDKWTLDVVNVEDAPKAKKLNNGIKVYIPLGNSDYVADADGHEVGMKGYKNRLNTDRGWDIFALQTQMGFEITTNLDEANVIVGSQYPINEDEVAAKIKAGTPYVAYTADAMGFLKAQNLMPGFAGVPDNDWWGYDALSMVEFPEDDIITATYKNEGDFKMYGYGGGYITSVPDGAKTLIKTTQDEPLEAFMTKSAIAQYKGSIQAIDYQKDGLNIAVFANTLVNKAHQQDDYRYLTAAVYSKLLGEDFVVEGTCPSYTLIKETPEVKQGDTALFASDAPFNKFKEVQVDNAVVDPKFYTAAEGSTEITLSGDFTKTLALGMHTITIVSNDGQVSGRFNVVKAADSNASNDDTNKPNTDSNKPGSNNKKPGASKPSGKLLPRTGDYATAAVPFVLVGAAAAVAGAYYLKKKNEKN